ncbi:PREDICTED: protein FAM166B isoform X2 [Chinchilla lanigera]|uniref:protein FAM166B isoform X2 n=1 Tax=Chinchilla lanigera TaxID=34839 RepID=UPI000697D715|nr:PREDICTED: protein FAM166B isoform X2 [Chinchilla lanigera]
MAGTCTAGLNPQDPHCIPGYTGHCPLLRFSMGQTYGQVTARLLRGPPGLAWPPAHRTLLPPIRPPGPPGLSRRSLPARCRHRRLRSSVTPGYTADQGSQELAKETTGDKDGEPESERGPVIAKVSPYSMDDTDPQKFFMSGERSSSFPVLTNQALREFGQKCSKGSAQQGPRPLPPPPRTYPQNLGLLPHYGGYVPGYKFLFGHTFGHLTHDALGLSTSQKQLLA